MHAAAFRALVISTGPRRGSQAKRSEFDGKFRRVYVRKCADNPKTNVVFCQTRSVEPNPKRFDFYNVTEMPLGIGERANVLSHAPTPRGIKSSICLAHSN